MKAVKLSALTAVCLVTGGFASAQTSTTTVDSYVQAAKVAAATDWAGTFLRLCIPSPAGFQPGLAAVGIAPEGRDQTPAKDKWYSEPAKVADNLYFIGTK